MATTKLYPNGDGSFSASIGGIDNSGSAPYYTNIDEGTDTPDDGNFISSSTGSATYFFTLTDCPGDVATVTACTIKVRTGDASKGRGFAKAQIFQSDESTALTAEATWTGSTTITTYTLNPTITGATTKTAWDGATIKFTVGSTGSGSAVMLANQVELTYTAASGNTYDETGSGGALGGGSQTINEVFNPSISGGALANGNATIYGLTNETASGGVLCGGDAIGGKVYTESTSGGATVAGSYSQSTLMDSLYGHWPLNETSGTRYDAHWDNDLTDNSSVGYATGKLGNAASFVSASNQYLSHVDNEDLNLDGESFSIACWVKFDSLTNAQSEDWVGFLGKGNDFGTNLFAVGLAYRPTLGRLQFTFADNAGNSSSVTANSFGAISTGTWYLVIVTYNSSNQAVSISVNGTENSVTSPYVIYDNAYSLNVGRMMANRYNFSGKVDSVSLWKRVLTSEEKTTLYNGGSGWDYVFDFETENITTSGGATAAGSATVYETFQPSVSGGAIANGGSRKFFICGDCCPSTLVKDSFWDDDGTELNVHSNNVGLWSASTGLLIYSNRVFSFEETPLYATVSAGQADFYISATVAAALNTGDFSIIFRYVNNSNYWRFKWEPENQCVRLLEITGGTENQRGFALVTTAEETDYTMNVLTSGNDFICSFNGTEISYTSSIFNTAQFVGFMFTDVGCELAEFCCSNPVHQPLVSGGILAAGDVVDSTVFNEIPSGGVLIKGLAQTDPILWEEGEGGATLGGSAQIINGLIASGGTLGGGDATLNWNVKETGSGGGVCAGVALSIYSITGSGGVVCSSAGYSTGYQLRKLLTITPLASIQKFPFPFRLNVAENLTVNSLYATDISDNELPVELVSYANGQIHGFVRTDLDEALETEVYIYYGGQ